MTNLTEKCALKPPASNTVALRGPLRWLIATAFAALLASNLGAADIASTQSGNWSDPNTWVGGTVPGDGDTALISSGHTVTLDMNATVGNVLSTTAVRVQGTLTWGAPNDSFTLDARGGVAVMPGGTLAMGTDSSPIPADKTATLLLDSVSTSSIAGLIVYDGGALLARGAVKRSSTTLQGLAPVGGLSLIVADGDEVGDWNIGDEVVVGGTDAARRYAEKRRITGISGALILLDQPLDYEHDAPAYVVNLTRNVVIRGADKDYAGYVINYNLASAANFDLKNAELAYLGKSVGGAYPGYKYGVTFDTNAVGNINDCSLHDGNLYGVYLYYSTGNAFTHNLFHGFSFASWVYYSPRNTFSSNHFVGNSYGIYFYYSNNSAAIENDSYSNNGVGIYANNSSYSTFASNRLFCNTRNGLGLWVVTDSSVTGNDIHDNCTVGSVNSGGLFARNADNSYIAHNRFYSNGDEAALFWICNAVTLVDNDFSNTTAGFSWGLYGDRLNNSTLIRNRFSSNAQQGIYLTTCQNTVFAESKIYGNRGNSIYMNSCTNIRFISCWIYDNASYVYTYATGLTFDRCALGYDEYGVSKPDGSYEVYGQGQTLLKNTRIYGDKVYASAFSQAGYYALSLRHNGTGGLAQLWGDYAISGSTLSLGHADDEYDSAATAPRLMRGSGHAATVDATSRTFAVSQVVSIEYRQGQWHVDGSSSGLDMVPAFTGSLANAPVPASQTQFNLTFAPGGTINEGDRLDFSLSAAAGDRGVQKRIHFLSGNSGYNGGRSKLTLGASGTLSAMGALDAPTIFDRANDAQYNYQIAVTGGSLYLQNFAMRHLDVNGLQFTANPSTAVMQNGSLDHTAAGAVSLITLSNVTNQAVFDGIGFLDSGGASPSNVTVTGTDAGLDWTFTNWSGTRGGSGYEYDPNGRITWIADATAPGPVTFLTALPDLSDSLDLSWISPGNDLYVSSLTYGSSFAIEYSSYAVVWSTTNAQVLISTTNVQPGTTQGYRLDGLFSGTTYYTVVWTQDPAGNWSNPSSIATAAVFDDTAPGAVTTLSVSSASSGGSLALRWSAPGDNGSRSNLSSATFLIQYSTVNIAWSSSAAQVRIATTGVALGSTVSVAVTGLTSGKDYYFRVWTMDEAGWTSALSNGATAYLPQGSVSSIRSGSWSDPATWSGGVAPREGDVVRIQAGHIVTLDQDATIGNDVSSNALTLQGTLTWGNPGADYALTVRGNLEVASGGGLLMGTSGSPIPANRTATLVMASSTTLNPYGLIISDGGTFSARGTPRNTAAFLSAAYPAGTVSIAVSDAGQLQGWAAGDSIVIVSNASGVKKSERRAIVQISGNQVTIDQPLDYLHSSSAPVLNLERNVVVRGTDSTLRSYIFNSNQSGAASFDVAGTAFSFLGLNDYYPGVYFGPWSRGSISQSVIKDGYFGLYLNYFDHGVFSENIFYGHQMSGMYGTNVLSSTVSSNYFCGNLDKGAYLQNSGDLAISENSFANNADGLSVSGTSVTFTSNSFFNNSSEGATVQGTGHRTVNNAAANNYVGFYFTQFTNSVSSGDAATANENDGFSISQSDRNLFIHDRAYFNYFGFELGQSRYNTIFKCSAGNNGANYGFNLYSWGGTDNLAVQSDFFNTTYGIKIDDSNWTLLANRLYGTSYGLQFGAANNVVADTAFSYNEDGELKQNSYDLYSGFNFSNRYQNCLFGGFYPAYPNNLSANGYSAISFRHNQVPGAVAVWGDYVVPSDLSVLDGFSLYPASATIPKLMSGTGHSASVTMLVDTAVVSQLISVEFRQGQWHVDGSIGGMDMAPPFTGGSALPVPAVNPQFMLTLSTGSTPREGDRLDFVLLAGSNDADAQKQVLFGPSKSTWNSGHSRISVNGGRAFRASGSPSRPVILDWLGSYGATYYSLVLNSGATVQISNFIARRLDNNGIQLTADPSTFSLTHGVFDFAMPAGASGAYIQLSNIQTQMSLNGLAFRDSGGAFPKNVRVTGTDTNLNWTFTNWSGDRGGPPNETDPNGKINWDNADVSSPDAVSDLIAAPGPATKSISLNWNSPGDDGSTGALAAPSQFAVHYATWAVTFSSSPAFDYGSSGHVLIATQTAAGGPQGWLLTGLTGNATYFIHLWTQDEAFNTSSLSNEATAYASGDLSPPDAISDLAATPDTFEGKANLSWTSPGDDGASGDLIGGWVRILYSTQPIPDFNSPPVPSAQIEFATTAAAGSRQGKSITGLNPGTTFFFAIETRDSAGNWSNWSEDGANVLSSCAVRDLQPNRPSGFQMVFCSTSSVKLEWTNPSPPAFVNDLDRFWIYLASYAFTGKTDPFVTVGATVAYPSTSAVVTSLVPATTYSFRMATLDYGDRGSGLYSTPLESSLSLSVSTFTLDAYNASAVVPPHGIVAMRETPITAQLLDFWGFPRIVQSTVAIGLTSLSGTGDFSLSSAPWVSTGTAMIPTGSSFTVVYFRDSVAGLSPVRASAAGHPDWGTTVSTVSVGYRLAITSLERSLRAGNYATDYIVLQSQDDDGNPKTVSISTQVFLASSRASGRFSLDAVNPVNFLNFSPGQSGAQFYYYDDRIGTAAVTISTSSLFVETSSQVVHVGPGYAHHFAVYHQTSCFIAQSSTLTLATLDAYDNRVADYVGTVAVTSDGSASLSPGTTGFRLTDGGSKTVAATDYRVESLHYRVYDTLFPTMSGTSGLFTWNGVFLTTASPAPSQVLQGASRVALLKLDLAASSGSAVWTQLNAAKTGSSTLDSDIPYFGLYRDSDGNGSLGTSDLCVASAPVLTGLATLQGFSLPLGTTVQTFFLGAEVSATATEDAAFGARLQDATAFLLTGTPLGNNGFPAQSGTVLIQHAPRTMTVTPTDAAPPSALQGSADIVVSRFAVASNTGSLRLDGLRVNLIGTGVSYTDIAAVKLYKENPAGGASLSVTGQGMVQASLVSFATQAFNSGNTAFLAFTSSQTILVTPSTYYLALDIAPNAALGALAQASFSLGSYFNVAAPDQVSNGNFPFASGGLTIAATVDTMTLVWTDLAPAAAPQGASNQVLARLTASTNQNGAIWTGLGVLLSTNAPDSDVAAVKLYREDPAGATALSLVTGSTVQATLISSGLDRFSNRSSTLTLNEAVVTAAQNYYLAVDLNPTAGIGDAIAVTVSTRSSILVAAPDLVQLSAFPWTTGATAVQDHADTLFAQGTDLLGGDAIVFQSSTNVAALKLTLWTDGDQVTWNRITLSRLGSHAVSDFAAVKLYKDGNANTVFDSSDTLLTSGTDIFSGASPLTLTLNAPQTLSVSSASYFVAWDVAAGAQPDDTLGLQVSSTGALGVAAPDLVGAQNIPIASGLAVIQDPRRPLRPVIADDGAYTKSTDHVHFTYSSRIMNGTIAQCAYALGSSTRSADLLDWTSASTQTADITAGGLSLANQTTCYVFVRTRSDFGLDSSTGVSDGITVDTTKPLPPSGALRVSVSGRLISIAFSSGTAMGLSGIAGYVIEEINASHPSWATLTTQMVSSPQPGASGVSALPESFRTPDLAPGGSDGPAAVFSASAQTISIPVGSRLGSYAFRVRSLNAAGTLSDPSAASPFTAVGLEALAQQLDSISVYPNPFDSRARSATINYILKSDAEVTLRIYDLAGRLIRNLVFPAGTAGGRAGSNDLSWDGTDDAGNKVSKGMYLAVVKTDGARQIVKIGVIH